MCRKRNGPNDIQHATSWEEDLTIGIVELQNSTNYGSGKRMDFFEDSVFADTVWDPLGTHQFWERFVRGCSFRMVFVVVLN